ncbi:MAG: hypothetical protein HYT98_01870 [Candidatus Sungbacteria bacterium]|nr:hypothetical protein [Candidatus Sungbacteria bacterium]
MLHILLAALALFFSMPSHALPQEDKPSVQIRNVSVTVLLDQILMYGQKDRSEFESKIRKIFETASHVFKKNFSITFSIDAFALWYAPAYLDTYDFFDPSLYYEWNPHLVLSEIAYIGKNNSSDITIGIIHRTMYIHKELEIETLDGSKFLIETEEPYIGYANADKNAAIVVWDEDSEHVLTHELSHLFYAGHTDEKSLMNETNYLEDKLMYYDDENWQIIMENRLRKFDKSFIP